MVPVPCVATAPVPQPADQRAVARRGPDLHSSALTLVTTFHTCWRCVSLPSPWLSGVAARVALTYAGVVIVALAATDAGRPDFIRSPKRVLAHSWEGLA